MDVWLINILGASAALCSMSSFVPQVIKIWREKHAESVSLRMYVVTVTGFTLWTVYGFLQGAWPLVASNLICLGLSAVILALKLHYDRADTKRAAEVNPRGPIVSASTAD